MVENLKFQHLLIKMCFKSIPTLEWVNSTFVGSATASFPVLHPASRHMQYSTARDWRLGKGLGMRPGLASFPGSHAPEREQ